MPTLNSNQRSALESAIIKARKLAENGARNALMAMAVDQADAFAHLTSEQRELRRRLRNRARLLGDKLEETKQQIDHLSYELAYEYWHKMLFAKFLESNSLLVHPAHNISVSLDECEEMSKEEGHANKWTAAAHYASRMLPAIFRTDDPLMQLDFSTEDRIALENLLAAIDENIFTADDSLGWVYQFWQSEAKAAINASGDKIDGEKLPAVTQLFTEPYMVHFLIDNTIGAWWVSRHPNEETPVKFEYLRLLPDGKPAAGKFEGWAATTAALTMLDPCMGSGHFVVATFNVLAKLRMHEENLSALDAAKKAIAENIFGLELDARCTQIAAFNLALAAWKFIGSYQSLPEMNLACSGIAPKGKKEDWLKLVSREKNAELKQKLENGMGELYELFQQAPELGSLLDPSTIKADAFRASFEELQPVLQKALEKEMELHNDEQAERGVMALGINSAAKILSKKFDLVITNVPYLGRGRQLEGGFLANYCSTHYPDAKGELATVFMDRMLKSVSKGCTVCTVMPQNWLFLSSYKKFRVKLLKHESWNFTVRLGSGAFSQITGAVVQAILIAISKKHPTNMSDFFEINASDYPKVETKDNALKNGILLKLNQLLQLDNPDARVVSDVTNEGTLLNKNAEAYQGLITGDRCAYIFKFWEISSIDPNWEYYTDSYSDNDTISGKENIIFWEQGQGRLYEFARKNRDRLHDMHESGNKAWGRKGVLLTRVGLKPTPYFGERYDNNLICIIPKKENMLDELWAFCSSIQYRNEVKKLDQKLSLTNATAIKVKVNLDEWVGRKSFPIPESLDPTQWLFQGDIVTSENPLQVAVARLLGYRYPKQPSDEILDAIEDDDGIVCIPSVNGEPAAADRLRDFLKAAYGAQWNNHTIEELLKQTGVATTNLETWLRESFSEQHIKLFQNRPFIWHIWDGRKDGFSVLVNYHKLTKENLQKIIFTYLGDWLRQCEGKVRNEESGSEGLLLAAKELKKKLELILEGEAPYDIFVRWKPLHQQPIGWEPDINDGVRMNIRPFVEGNILRKKPNIKWEKDRGKNPPGSPWGEDRINDSHLSLAAKREAKEKFEREQKEKQKQKASA